MVPSKKMAPFKWAQLPLRHLLVKMCWVLYENAKKQRLAGSKQTKCEESSRETASLSTTTKAIKRRALQCKEVECSLARGKNASISQCDLSTRGNNAEDFRNKGGTPWKSQALTINDIIRANIALVEKYDFHIFSLMFSSFLLDHLWK